MILRRLARPMLAGIFIAGGINVLRSPAAHAEAAKPVVDAALGVVGDRLPARVPTDPVTLVRIDAAVKIGAGLALATGRVPRLAALVLAGSLVPTTLAAHRFWDEKDPGERQRQQVHFLKNVGLLGGLLLAVGDTEGRPSLSWRARRAGRQVGKHAHELGEWAHDAGDTVAKTPRKARKALAKALPG
jgi:uncharacterized membrane protein YphA (DoxX/SURF4 family)